LKLFLLAAALWWCDAVRPASDFEAEAYSFHEQQEEAKLNSSDTGSQADRHLADIHHHGAKVDVQKHRIDLGTKSSTGMLAFTLNEGEMGVAGAKAIIKRVLEEADDDVNIVVLASQEVQKFWVPEPGFTSTPWNVYRTTHPLYKAFKLQTLIFVRPGLQVRTRRITPANVWKDLAFYERPDKGAPGCQEGQPGGEGCWGYIWFMNCKAEAPNVEDRRCSKGTMVTLLELTIPPEGAPERLSDVKDAVAFPQYKSTFLAITNSHMGRVYNPLEIQLVLRAEELNPVMALLDGATTAEYQVPVVMVGDWNFRMSSAGGIYEALKGNASIEIADYFKNSYKFTGSIIAPDSTGKMHLAVSEDPGTPINMNAMYDEIAVLRGLAMAAPQGPVRIPGQSYFELHDRMKGFHTLVMNRFREKNEHMPCTCRYKEGSKVRRPVPVDTTFNVETDILDGDFKPMIYTENAWGPFKEAGYQMQVDDQKKGLPKEGGKIFRAPSKCDRMIWSDGAVSGFHNRPPVLTLVENDDEQGISYLDAETFTDMSGKPWLLETDHLALRGKWTIGFHSEDAVAQLLSEMAPPRSDSMGCCCKREHLATHVEPDSCSWVDLKDAKGQCGLGAKVLGYQDVDGSEKMISDSDVVNQQWMCEHLFGELLEGPAPGGVSAGDFVVKRVASPTRSE